MVVDVHAREREDVAGAGEGHRVCVSQRKKGGLLPTEVPSLSQGVNPKSLRRKRKRFVGELMEEGAEKSGAVLSLQ